MNMNALRIFGIVLIIVGVVALAYGRFTYTKDTHEARLGKLELSVKDKETVHVPPWAGWVSIGVGVLVLVAPLSRKG
jgi:uncharacterized membrane protein YidH (DUF202 family)